MTNHLPSNLSDCMRTESKITRRHALTTLAATLAGGLAIPVLAQTPATLSPRPRSLRSRSRRSTSIPTTAGCVGWAWCHRGLLASKATGYLAATQSRDGNIQLVTSRNHYMFNLAWIKTLPPPPKKS